MVIFTFQHFALRWTLWRHREDNDCHAIIPLSSSWRHKVHLGVQSEARVAQSQRWSPHNNYQSLLFTLPAYRVMIKYCAIFFTLVLTLTQLSETKNLVLIINTDPSCHKAKVMSQWRHSHFRWSHNFYRAC